MIDESLADMTTLGVVPHSVVSSRGGGDRRSTRGGRQNVTIPQRERRYVAGQHQSSTANNYEYDFDHEDEINVTVCVCVCVMIYYLMCAERYKRCSNCEN
jgi:hypothetical protein